MCYSQQRFIAERRQMPTQILPSASLRSANRLPAARTLSWVSNYLIGMALWSIGRAIFRVASNFLPVLRERRALLGGVEQGPDHRRAIDLARVGVDPKSEGFRGQRRHPLFFPLLSAITVGPRQRIELRADTQGGNIDDAGASSVFGGGRAACRSVRGRGGVRAEAGRHL